MKCAISKLQSFFKDKGNHAIDFSCSKINIWVLVDMQTIEDDDSQYNRLFVN